MSSTLGKRRNEDPSFSDHYLKKEKLKDDNAVSIVGTIGTKFSSQSDTTERKIKESTIGLISLDEMKATQQKIIEQCAEKVEPIIQTKPQKPLVVEKRQENVEKATNKLSFNFEDEADEGIEFAVKIRKNPEVDTSFLPDKNRDTEENLLREKLKNDWIDRNRKAKEEEVILTYAYWDGSGHRKTCKLKKGNTIQQFLQKALVDLRGEFLDLRTVTVDELMFIKDDLILPNHYSFYDFVIKKLTGRNGPIFSFDFMLDDKAGISSERPEITPGKVCFRGWYEKNKHIFPCNRWEPYNPDKRYERLPFKKL